MNFKGNKEITLQPNDAKVNYNFTFTVATITGNDGFLPYGTSIDSLVVTLLDEDGASVEGIYGTPTVSSNIVSVKLNYPPSAGRYSLQFILTLDDGEVIEADFTRIIARDL